MAAGISGAATIWARWGCFRSGDFVVFQIQIGRQSCSSRGMDKIFGVEDGFRVNAGSETEQKLVPGNVFHCFLQIKIKRRKCCFVCVLCRDLKLNVRTKTEVSKFVNYYGTVGGVF